MSIQQKLVSGASCFKPIIKKILPEKLWVRFKDSVLDHQLDAVLTHERAAFDRSAYPDGINLIGLVRAEMGLGQSCRLMAQMIGGTKYPVALYDFNLGSELLRSQDHTLDDQISNELKYNVNLIHINPGEMPLLYTKMDSSSWEKRYNIAFWLWELEEIPKAWETFFPMLDEIWTPSEFISNNLRKVTDLPVRTIPYCVKAPVDERYTRDYFGLPEDKFLFLAMYDSNSTRERKNPMGAILAFKSAFKKEDAHVGLVLKINNARTEDLELLQGMLEGYQNIYYITDTMSKIEVNSLIKAVDVFVSLHRAEGFGLVMAEAMLNGTPAIATNWSSNTEFMNDDVACMVDYTFCTLKEDCPPYKAGAVWADPNSETAAAFMKRLCEDPAYYQEKSRKARAYIQKKLSMDQAVRLIEGRMEEIYDKAL